MAGLDRYHWETEADAERLGVDEPFALAWAPVDEVLGLFAEVERRTTTLVALATEVGASPDDARRALLRLVEHPGVRASVDVMALGEDEAFEVEVDFVAVEP